MRPIVAFQGESGAFSEKAIEYLVEGPVKLLSCNTFDACTGAVVQGIADLAVIPVENLIAGPVHAALDALAERYRTTAVLRYVHGLDLAAIAEITDEPVATVKTHLHRARAALAVMLRRPRETRDDGPGTT